MDRNQLLRALPKVDEVLRQPAVAGLELPQTVVTDLVRESIDALRRRVLEAVKSIIGLTPKIILVGPGTLPRSEGKIRRVIDNRNK